MKRSITHIILCLLMVLPMLAQDTPAPEAINVNESEDAATEAIPADGDRPDRVRPDDETRDRHMAHLRAVADLKRRIDMAIAHLDNDLGREFRELVRNHDLTFEQMRRLAQLREHLAGLAAPELVAALQRLREHFANAHPDLGNDRPRPDRPELTDEQKEIIRQHHAALQQAQEELNAILVTADASGEYGTLLALDDRTPEQQRRLSELRRELIAGSDDAQAKIHEIHELNATFRENHPHAHAAPARIVRHTVHTIKRNVEAIHTLEEQIDTLLADASEEYAALLDKDELTEEEAARLAELRRSLIPEVDGAADLARSIHHLRHNIREKKVRVDRIRHRLEHRDGDRPTDTVPARGAAGGAGGQSTE